MLNTNSLTVATPTVFAKNNAMLEIYSEADLRGKKIAVLKDIYVVQQAIAPYRDEIDIVETDSALNMMKMVYEGKVDAAFGLSYHYYLIGKHMFIGIKPVYFSPEFKTNATASIRPEWPEFISIINKGLEAIGKGKLNAINQRWSQLQVKEKYVPTKTEKAWLATHKNIRLGVDPQWAPFEFFDATKVYSGIASAYVKIINETLDINMYPLKGFSWSEVVEKTKTGEIDVLPCAMQSTKRSKFLNFTKPYISSSLVVLTHDKTPFISDLHELSGKTIAVIKGYITEDILKNDFPNHKFIQVNNIEEALLRVSEGSIDAFIGNLASITYVTERLGITNLKVAGTTPYKLELAFAVRKDWPELVGILDRLISSIPDNDKKNIHSSWVNVRVERQKNWRQVGIIIGTISFIMTVIIFWNRRLAKEIEGRKQAQSLTNRYEFIVNSVKDMMTFIDNDLNYLAVNDTWCTTMQIERENVIGENIATTWEEETFIDKIKPNMDRCFAGERVSFLIWQNTPSHGVRHFKVMLYPFKNTEGVTTNIVTVNRDVTEQTMAENALRESEQLFKRTFDQAPVGAAIVDLNGHFEKVNAKFCQIMGYSANELLDFTIFDITHPNDRQIEEKNVSSLLSGNIEQYQNDTRYTRKDGQTVWGRLSLRMVADINGKPLYFLPMIEDITDQKQAVNEYRKLSQAIEQSQVSVVLTDLEGIMEYVNPKFCELTGYSSEEAIGKNPRILNSGKQSREFYKDLWDTIKNGKTWQGELTNKKKTGELYWEKAIISPVRDENNQVTHFVAVKENITNIKRINMALKERITELAETKRSMLKIMKDLKEARHTAEEATRAKSHFLANMSHEIRTPMNAILGLVHLALQTKLNSKQEDYLVKVDRSAHSLLGIINDILDFSKIEAGKLTLEKTEFNLQEVLDDITNIIDLRAQEKGVELIFLIDPKTPTTIIGDPLRLYQVLINLTNNALKFTDNGEIVIEISPGSIIDKRVTLLFAVRDTGIGISRIDQKRLFQSFNQADSSVTRKYGGTGLGLSISKKLIEMMHGTIKVKSQKGHGSTFSFSAIFDLPIAEPSPRVMPKDLIGLRTLVIDDNQTACQSLATALQSFSFRVTTSFSGAEALDELEKASNENDPYNLVLVDWQMPEMDSLETCRQIQENTSLSVNPAIIMVTAYGREEVVQRIGELGIENYIFKPVSYSILFDAVLEVFGKETLLAETRDKNIIVTSPSIDIAGAHILLAEDNKINQQVARELLERWKLLVDIANNGQEAVKMANENSYDLILMDIQMPKLDGIAATQEIRTSLSKNNHIPIVAMTAHAMVGDREKSLEAGMNDHINKPINPDELYNCIISMISLKDIAKHTDSNPKKDDTYSKLQTNRTLETKPINFPANIPGFDLKSGLMRVAGNKKLYLDILLEFQEEHEHFSDRIAEALDNNDNLSALSITHSLKGVSGNLGMNELHEKAIKLENGLKKQSATIKDLLDDTLNTLQATLTQINKIVPHNKESTINEVPDEIIDFDLIIPKITELRQLLELNDMASGKKFLEIKDSLLQQDPNNLSLLEKAINSLDFQQALAIVNKIEV
ncbi:MAG: PAS domain S-box protein [Desulfobulbaceae bacterium]|nr:PAS domain S-box protein [Desulfobulbaceae bacterium]